MVAESRYDDDSGLYYSSDAGFIDTGTIMGVQSEFRAKRVTLYDTLRSFPNGTRNCYTLKPLQGRNGSYLIRAYFQYGNYDGLGTIPNFDLYIGVNYWTTVLPKSATHKFSYELIYSPGDADLIYVCLVKTKLGIPFISALDLRLVNNSAYKHSSSGALMFYNRSNAGPVEDNNYYNSVKDDPYDRRWAVIQSSTWGPLQHNVSMNFTYTNAYKVPPSILQTAAIPLRSNGSLNFYWNWETVGLAQLYWHFAEIQELGVNDTREFDIYLNGTLQSGKVRLNSLQPLTINSTPTMFNGTPLEFSITRTSNSTLPPLLNAYEIYKILDLPKSATYQDDVNAMMNIKMNYSVPKGWQGDPCLPIPAWDGLNCSVSDDNHSPRITSLNLSMRGLVGNIPHSMSALTSLEYLNLSCNSLTGDIPEFLAELPSLHTLDLSNNKLTDQVPIALRKKADNGSLDLRLGMHRELCGSNPYTKNFWEKIGIILAAAASVTFIGIGLAVFCICKQMKQARSKIRTTSITSENRRFTHSEVMSMTNNFKNIIGKGASGKVYLGFLKDGTHCVAVKMLHPSLTLNLKLFHNEAELLARVHHRNLVSLIGYCEEDTTMALIYEHVANGNLQQHLTGNNIKVLSWKERLQIAIDAAQGLEYLHSGCKPPVVHRDMKTSNILLDENLHGKISDFGISKAFSTEGTESSLTTNVMGTHGYLDPEYYITHRLNKKSDVYSFGVVLLELITGHPSIIRTNDAQPIHVVAWTMPKLESGDIDQIVDNRLRGNYSTNSAWKALEIAMMCVSTTAVERPSMNQVLIDLNGSLDIEVAHEDTRPIGNHGHAYPLALDIDDDDIAIADSSMEMGPSAR